jgi:uncharacterized OB-fold protein
MTSTPTIRSRSLPRIDDPDTKGFFDAAAAGCLAVCTCALCQRVLHPPRAYCADCQAFDTTWVAVSGSASLVTWTVVEHDFGGAFEAPYTVVLVALEELPDIRMVGYIKGRPSLEPGIRMKVRFEQVGDGIVLPQWQPADGGRYDVE